MNRGISIIILIITIAILSILAAVTLSSTDLNFLGRMQSGVFISDYNDMQEALNLFMDQKLAENSRFNRSTFNMTGQEAVENDIIPEKYKDSFEIYGGEIAPIGGLSIAQIEAYLDERYFKDAKINSNNGKIRASFLVNIISTCLLYGGSSLLYDDENQKSKAKKWMEDNDISSINIQFSGGGQMAAFVRNGNPFYTQNVSQSLLSAILEPSYTDDGMYSVDISSGSVSGGDYIITFRAIKTE